MLSVVIPVYNEEAVLEKTASVIRGVLSAAAIGCEILFVDDGSKDATWEKITALSASGGVRGVRFSRNFGKEAAILAGLSAAKGDCCVVIDSDLQHPPEKIVEMYRLWEQGYEIVEGRKASRGAESRMHGLAARAFYSLISRATGIDMANASDFKLLDRKAVNVLISMRERNAFFRALSSWIGFKTALIPFNVQERAGGSSRWSTAALAKYAVENIASFSAAPMQIVTVLGGVMLLVALVLGTIALVQKFSGRALGGFTTVILIQLFSSSIIMISLGVIGYFISKIYEEVKGRPRYIVTDTCGDAPEAHGE